MNPPISPAELAAFIYCCFAALGIAFLIMVVAAFLEWRRISKELDQERRERDLDPPKRDLVNRKSPNWIRN